MPLDPLTRLEEVRLQRNRRTPPPRVTVERVASRAEVTCSGSLLESDRDRLMGDFPEYLITSLEAKLKRSLEELRPSLEVLLDQLAEKGELGSPTDTDFKERAQKIESFGLTLRVSRQPPVTDEEIGFARECLNKQQLFQVESHKQPAAEPRSASSRAPADPPRGGTRKPWWKFW